VWVRSSDETVQSWTPEFVPGPSLSEVPLYILISGQTFSAAEAFTYALKHLGRATVVGTRSKGGGHPVEFVRLVRADLVVAMMVPNAKSLNQITGTSWEGVGVAPDVEVRASRALTTAYNAAVDELLANTENELQRFRIEWARSEFQATQDPPELSGEQLAEYAGDYETCGFSVGEDEVLFYQRAAGSLYPMVPMGNDLFRFEGHDTIRFRFARNGDGIVDRAIRLSNDGTTEVHRRNE
jgi:hypothetical protein